MARHGGFRLAGAWLSALVTLGSGVALAGAPRLVKETTAFGTLAPKMDPTVIRARNVRVDVELLRSGASPSVELPLFDGMKPLVLVRDRTEAAPGGFVWLGHVAGQAQSQAVLSVVDDVVSGNITTLEGEVYQLRYAGNGIHALRQINHAAFPEEAPPLEVAPSEEDTSSASADFQVTADTGSTIDVMVVYTATARSASGGASAMSSLINLAMSETNTGYSNSGVNQRVRLVHTAELSYAESGSLSTDLSRLRSTTDGYMDGIHTTRNTYKADLVSLFVENGGSYCGMAYIMTSVSTSFASSAFSVVDQDCATGYYSFGHEMGHNMGARHDRYVDNTDGSPYSYNHGYYYSSGKWRTVMAYNDGCQAVGVSCTRINYWSNPNKFYNGVAMGVSSTSTKAADNHLTLNNTAYTVANFRASQ